MIQRQQRIVFWCLMLCIVAMSVVLVVERQRARDRVLRVGDQTPLDAPTGTTEPVTLEIANDNTGSIRATQREMALPTDATARARALIDHLIAQYSMPGSAHPLPPGAAVNEVFLVPLPVVGYAATSTPSALRPDRKATQLVGPPDGTGLQPQNPGGELAVIDLRSSFVEQHPSGVEVESLTVRSILGTLHANLPQIEQVRFLVDGAAQATLAGHADLMRTYASRDMVTATEDGGGS